MSGPWRSGRELGPYPAGVIGEEITAPDRPTLLDSGFNATPARIEQARKLGWQTGEPADFERVSKREWRDETGASFRHLDYSPLLQTATSDVGVVLVVGGELVFLLPSALIERPATVLRWQP